MHRVERMELDEAAGELPSLAQSFVAQAGRTLAEVFGGGGSGYVSGDVSGDKGR
jgi:hypothetical protein